MAFAPWTNVVRVPSARTSGCSIPLTYVSPHVLDMTWQGEQDGVDAPKESGKGAIHPSEWLCGRAWGHSPPCSRRARCGERNVPWGPLTASCSPVGGKGRLVLSTLLMVCVGKTVKAPTPMHAHNGASMPSLGGREDIKGSGVSRRPGGNWRILSFLYYFYRRKENNTPKPSTVRAGQFSLLFKGANNAMATPPPPC